ncbi:MAG: glycosyltransferase family 4 protein [Gammaproteobacteria bacterium]|nr:glycosyltransferase family 4 protein [Gammaproteobacteria bacterium]
MSAIIVIFHTPSNAGYAMTPLEKVFFQVACSLYGSQKNVHFAFKDLDNGMPKSLPKGFCNVIEIDSENQSQEMFSQANSYIKRNNISSAFVFDLQVKSSICSMLRHAGIKTIISYWGSPISSLNSKYVLLLKRIEVALTQNKPDLFIFESEAMRELAVYGRGIFKKNTCVIPTGVDTDRFQPNSSAKNYLNESFDIPKTKKIALYTGHMEERKGVKVIINAAIKLKEVHGLDNWHFLICGNRPGEEKQYLEILDGTQAKNSVTFAGYRSDIDKISPGCEIGIIASTGWDSFPMSSLEMAACGLPIFVSELQGLTETIDEGKTGQSFEPGNSARLAKMIFHIDQNEPLRKQYSEAARKRILGCYSLTAHKKKLLRCISSVLKKTNNMPV